MTADRTIRIGIIGAGFARTTQIPGFKACAGAQIVAIASAHRERAAEVAREFAIDHVEDDWRALVARDDLDLVSIVTPVVTHCEMTLAALDHGKAVLCEKPMAMNAGEARRMADRGREAGGLGLIDHELRFLTGRVKLHELLRRGDIGKVRHVRLILRADSRADPTRHGTGGRTSSKAVGRWARLARIRSTAFAGCWGLKFPRSFATSLRMCGSARMKPAGCVR